jgi:hypothetical protein
VFDLFPRDVIDDAFVIGPRSDPENEYKQANDGRHRDRENASGDQEFHQLESTPPTVPKG